MGSSLRWGPCHSLHLKPLPFCRKRGPVKADTLTTVTGLSTKFSRVTGRPNSDCCLLYTSRCV